MTVEQYQQQLSALGINRGKLEASAINVFEGDSKGAKKDTSNDLTPEEKEENRRRHWVYKQKHKEQIAKRRKQWESENCGQSMKSKLNNNIVYGKRTNISCD